MRLVRYEHEGEIQIGVKVAQGVVPTGYVDMIELIKAGDKGLNQAAIAAKSGTTITNYRLLAPIPNPEKLLCSGINYASHKDENPNAVFPKRPSFFSKLPSSIIGPDEDIIIPSGCEKVDYEVELAFVIGKTAKNVTKASAFDYVFGYTVINDVSERALQTGLQHETIGKGVDTFCPMGPELVLKDEITNPAQLQIASYLNGVCMQSSSTADMIFDIPTLIEFITSYITLHPGDVLSTGTPAGIGLFRNPQVFMKNGDIVMVEVGGIGKLQNKVKG